MIIKSIKSFRAGQRFLALKILLFIGIAAPLISNDKPLLISTNDGWSFPILAESIPHDLKIKNLDRNSEVNWYLSPPIAFSPNELDVESIGLHPLSSGKTRKWNNIHWLGTDHLGRDVMAQLVYGCRTSVLIGLMAMLIALTIGILLGATSGYWNFQNMRISFPAILFILTAIIFLMNALIVLYYLESVNFLWIFCAVIISAIILLHFILKADHYFLRKTPFKWRKRLSISFSPDHWGIAMINYTTALPGYFVLLAMLSVWQDPGKTGIAFILGLLMWPDIARLTRSAVILAKNEQYHEAAEGLGYSNARIIFAHLLPNAVRPALISLGFGIGAAIIAESFLSFIGVAPAEMISWGSMLSLAKDYPELWWLSVFPGAALVATVLLFYRMTTSLEKAGD